MRPASWRLIAFCVLVGFSLGCGREESKPVVQAPQDPHASWPDDTIERPEFLSVVEREAGHVDGDAESARIPSAYMIPDWAVPTSTISAKGPRGSKITFHLLPRFEKLRVQEDQHIEQLLAGKHQAAESLVVARPWIGWYGQGTGVEAVSTTQSQAYTLRVYLLFQEKRQLEVHVQWPTGNKEAYDEGQTLLAHLVYSVKPLGKT